jgi:leucyl/phenylalanyl-tRNA--protein transferase
MRSHLSPERLLATYASGIFPMADEAGSIHWLAPDPRAIIELDAFKASRSLRAVRRRRAFRITINAAFEEVIDACAQRGEGTWISNEIKVAYTLLHRLGAAHSVEAWQGAALAGGLYGIAIGGAFFGESMFHHTTDASKVALMALVERMRERGFVLLDIQFMTEHLRHFGACEIPRAQYETRLRKAVQMPRTFVDGPDPIVVEEAA